MARSVTGLSINLSQPEEGRNNMLQRHPNCKQDNCEVCLEDHEALEERLRKEMGGNLIDHLCQYRKFMDKRLGRSSETDWGWACPEVFEEENIKAYLREK